MTSSRTLDLTAVSPDGVWSFDASMLRAGERAVEPYTIDFFSRWTFARFMADGSLVLAFESSQPWSDYGSYGDRYWGVEVMALIEGGRWALAAVEFDYRSHDESFEPLDVLWHPSGVLAWLREDELHVQRQAHTSYDADMTTLLPRRDSDYGLSLCHDFWGRWQRLEIDAEGRMLTAWGEERRDVFDLEARVCARDGGEWVPFDSYDSEP